MFERFADALFPCVCAACGCVGDVLCPACAHGFPTRRLVFGSLTVWAAGPYAGALRSAILRFKRGGRDAGRALERLLAERFSPRVPGRGVIVPVPTLAARHRERGFDQSVRLAAALGGAAGLPVVLALAQSRADAQRGRSRAERLNARGRFSCVAPPLVRGVRVVLVDDVVTTGATLSDCARALRAAGADVTEAFVLAHA